MRELAERMIWWRSKTTKATTFFNIASVGARRPQIVIVAGGFAGVEVATGMVHVVTGASGISKRIRSAGSYAFSLDL
jgi:NADH dehydrogenase FAD-containing subunit